MKNTQVSGKHAEHTAKNSSGDSRSTDAKISGDDKRRILSHQRPLASIVEVDRAVEKVVELPVDRVIEVEKEIEKAVEVVVERVVEVEKIV